LTKRKRMIIFIDRTFKQGSAGQRVFLTLTCWLYNVKFPENYFFYLRCDAVFLSLHFPTFRSVLVFTLSRSSSLRTMVSGCWYRVLRRMCHFSKIMELHKNSWHYRIFQHFVIPLWEHQFSTLTSW